MALRKSHVSVPARVIFRDPLCFLAFGFGSGLAPVAPGTFGTLAAVPIYGLMAGLGLPAYAAVVFVLFLAGIPICRHCEQRLGVHDAGGIVWDEIVGYLVTMAAVPFSWTAAAVGFLLFRLFDVLKPWPISRIDRGVSGGLGVMLDDVLAGVLAGACLYWARPFLGF